MSLLATDARLDAIVELATAPTAGTGQLYMCRLERKLVVSPDAADALRRLVSARLSLEQWVPDRSKTLIHSIYFDSEDFALYRRSLESGPSTSMKLRLRAYGDARTPESPDPSRFFEAKLGAITPAGGRMKRKSRILLSARKVAALMDSENEREPRRISGRKFWKPVLAYMEALKIRPRLTVSYVREAWEDAAGLLRVTFDEGYRASRVDPGGASPLASPAGVLGPAVIVEIKFIQSVPAWLQAELERLGLPPEGQSFSKFRTAVPLVFPDFTR